MILVQATKEAPTLVRPALKRPGVLGLGHSGGQAVTKNVTSGLGERRSEAAVTRPDRENRVGRERRSGRSRPSASAERLVNLNRPATIYVPRTGSSQAQMVHEHADNVGGSLFQNSYPLFGRDGLASRVVGGEGVRYQSNHLYIRQQWYLSRTVWVFKTLALRVHGSDSMKDLPRFVATLLEEGFQRGLRRQTSSWRSYDATTNAYPTLRSVIRYLREHSIDHIAAVHAGGAIEGD
ncbi:hypothetical protein BD311DRAFT_798695 [Dichomitus squalens]|uniref:Uncharacterized protein n=1 Tax=Dichomitus squalens TaxID=114155 RepID=A0A4Q9MEJ0_9APHY|nr:hypothetical protein BD311DRAFT_798695 [Dichomitus squalens]